ncbi:hypothetical protein [Fodinibius halophilus]|uniref:DUF4402 domain-containing protein n=1 Tax=Fodinibius halophilus TaxID=1736908 RepID=A0A6M1T1F9_9BACT|nr:hypothetical protein [Fodinibius halophilus]NGP87827.1 hypothetical protein [Fodinibius halophilus]
MKQLIRAFGFLLFFSFSMAFPLAAQNDGSDVSVTVSTSIISSIEMVTLQSMRLRETQVENERIIINPQTSNDAGKMVAMGTPNSDIRISYLQQREITQANGSENLIFNYEVAANQQDDQATAEILDNENRDFVFNEEGQLYLWIGGSVDISTATPGNYQGEFTLEIEYI